MKLDNAVVLITGGASGLGWACAQALLHRGSRVSIVDLKEPAVEGERNAVMFSRGDITSPDIRQMTVDRTLDRFGRIDVLINNAGVGLYAYAENASLDASRRMFEVNVFAPLAMAQLVAPIMRRSQSGVIVNIGSIGGKIALPWASMYCASKFALHCVSDSLRRELDGSGVSVVTVMPGVVATQFRENVLGGLPPARVGSMMGMDPARLARTICRKLEKEDSTWFKPWYGRLFAITDVVAPWVTNICLKYYAASSGERRKTNR